MTTSSEKTAGEELVAVPRSLLGAACAAIRGKRDAPNTLSQLNRYAVHGPALDKPASSPAGGDAREALRDLYEWYDRDGSVGGASEVFEKHRSSLSQSTSAGRGE